MTGNWEIYRMTGGHDKRRIDRPAPDPLAGARPHAVRLPRWPLHAFVSDRDGNHEVYRMDADGSNVVRLTRTPEAEIHPFWSSDSRTIIYNRRVADERRYAIWTMGVDGANGIEVLRDDPLNSYAPSCPGPAVDRPAPGHYFVLQST